MGVKRAYFVRACWDDDAEVFWSESDIKGLHIEAATLEEFQDLVEKLAPDLIFENHLRHEELGAMPLKDLIPSVVLRAPEFGASSA